MYFPDSYSRFYTVVSPVLSNGLGINFMVESAMAAAHPGLNGLVNMTRADCPTVQLLLRPVIAPVATQDRRFRMAVVNLAE